MSELAIYDMDRTITRRGTYTPWLLFWAWRQAPWRLLLLPATLGMGFAYLAGAITRSRLKELNQALLMGASVDRAAVERVAAAFAERVVLRGVLPGAVARIAADRAEGRHVVLATASFAFYAEAIAARLAITSVIATRSIWHGDGLLPRIDGENCYGAAKLTMVEAWLLTIQPGHIRFYSDHVSDLPLFERADEAVATNPS
ncbi:MAG: HAD family hydrolase, partial [Janthinobacterium lividum]